MCDRVTFSGARVADISPGVAPRGAQSEATRAIGFSRGTAIMDTPPAESRVPGHPVVTRVLEAVARGEPRAAERLLPLLYDELRLLAEARLAREAPGQTLDATALVHEAYLRLVGPDPERSWDGRGHFFAAAAEAMRRILVERARRRKSLKRGGGRDRIVFDLAGLASPEPEPDLLALDDALDRLAERDPIKAELVKLLYFAGLTVPQAAEALGLSHAAAKRAWAYARAWLRLEVRGGGQAADGGSTES
jgi:RNA polymerase sigma factor (TIGR02999 family)